MLLWLIVGAVMVALFVIALAIWLILALNGVIINVVDHSNISPEHDLNRSGLHLNTKGTARLATNFINYLRDD